MLPLPLEYPPMEAQLSETLPVGAEWHYEPKWDGFRCIAFRDGDKVDLQSKNGQPLGRYFPELIEALRKVDAKQFVLDGEIVTVVNSQISFDDLLQRIHPAESRIKKLAKDTPANYIVFDLLVDPEGTLLSTRPFSDRRKALETFADQYLEGQKTIDLSPLGTDASAAQMWLEDGTTGIDGVMAKRTDLPYLSGERLGMKKVKRMRTVDCVVGGFRYASSGKVLGALLLGLFNESGLLDHVGFCSAFTDEKRKEWVRILEPLIEPPGFTGKAPGGPSRWSTERSTQWEPLRNELVIEVRYDHFSGDRFRHGTKFLRFRPDKSPSACTLDQVISPQGAIRNMVPGSTVVDSLMT